MQRGPFFLQCPHHPARLSSSSGLRTRLRQPPSKKHWRGRPGLLSAASTLEGSPKHGSPPPAEPQRRGHPHLGVFRDSSPSFNSSGPGPCAYCCLGTLEPLECLLATSVVSPNRGLVSLISVPTAPSAMLGTCKRCSATIVQNTEWNEPRHLPCPVAVPLRLSLTRPCTPEGRCFRLLPWPSGLSPGLARSRCSMTFVPMEVCPSRVRGRCSETYQKEDALGEDRCAGESRPVLSTLQAGPPAPAL